MNNSTVLVRYQNILIFLILMLLAFLFINGCGGKEDLTVRYRAEELLSKADRLKEQLFISGTDYSNDDFNRLREAYEMVINAVDLPLNQTEVEVASEEIKQAWAVALLANTRIASLYLDRREYDSAFVYYQKVAINPAVDNLQRNVVYRHMAYVREKAGDFEKAAALYDTVSIGYIELLNPARPEMEAVSAPISRAEMYRYMGDNRRFNEGLESARTYYRQIIEDYPGSNIAEISLGKIAASFLLQGQYNEALKILKSAGKDEESRLKPGTLLLISDIYMNNMKDYTGAEKYYREFINLYPDHTDKPKALLGLGLAFYEKGRYKEAKDTVGKIEKIRGASDQIVAQAFNLTALCYEAEGNWQLAEGQLEFIKATFPGNRIAYEAALYIVSHYRSHGSEKGVEREFNEAVDYIKGFVESASLNSVAAAQAAGYLARAYIENGDIETAIEQLKKLYYKYPLTPDGLMAPLKIADLYENVLHDNQSAVEWLDTYIKDNSSRGDLKDVKAHIENLRGQGS